MKKMIFLCFPLSILFVACQKTNDTDNTSLVASATSVAVGETVTFTASSNNNMTSWSVNPKENCIKAFETTTSDANVNSITFNASGDYTVGVRTRKMRLNHHANDSIWRHHGVDSAFNHHGGHHGGCKRGNDSASVLVHVH